MTNHLRGVIFDLDGTLGNTLPLCIATFRQAIEPLAARTLTDAEIIATFGPSEEGTIRALAPNHFEAGVSDYLRHYEALHHICPEPFPKIIDLLTDLKDRGVRLGLVTGKGPKSAWISLHRFGMADIFELVEAGDPDGPRKVEGIRHILAQWQMEPSEVVYIGDAPSDVTAARTAGIGVVGAAWAETTEQELLAAEKPDALLLTVEELGNWLEVRIL
jgi:HAD superfamily hydrolase (TIGR01549 family)